MIQQSLTKSNPKRAEVQINNAVLSPDFGSQGAGVAGRKMRGTARRLSETGMGGPLHCSSALPHDQSTGRVKPGKVTMDTWGGTFSELPKISSTSPAPAPNARSIQAPITSHRSEKKTSHEKKIDTSVSETPPRKQAAKRQAQLLAAVASAAAEATPEADIEEGARFTAAAQEQREQAVASAVEEATKKAWQEAQREARHQGMGKDDIVDVAVTNALNKAATTTREWAVKSKDAADLKELLAQQQAAEAGHHHKMEQIRKEREAAKQHADRLKVENEQLEQSCEEFKSRLVEIEQQQSDMDKELQQKHGELMKSRKEQVGNESEKIVELEEKMQNALASSYQKEKTLQIENAAFLEELEATRDEERIKTERLNVAKARAEELDSALQGLNQGILDREAEILTSNDLVIGLERQLKEVDEVNWSLERQLSEATGEKNQFADLLYVQQAKLAEVRQGSVGKDWGGLVVHCFCPKVPKRFMA